MEFVPAVDPIPLPAPVAFFKALHTATLAGHFLAVHCMVGGLIIGTLWAFAAQTTRNPTLMNASGLIARRLPIAMAFVINLGVPPLLFTQVLYGRALYTSSILIGAYWIGVVFLVMAVYSCLYGMAKRAEAGRPWGWLSLLALLMVFVVAKIYTSNMTLMLRPEAWAAMYGPNPSGTHLPSGDPTMLPRWLYMMTASAGIAGVALAVLAMKHDLAEQVGPFLRRWGGRLMALFTVLLAGLGLWVFRAQPASVRETLMANPLYKASAAVWFLTIIVLVGLGALVSRRTAATTWPAPLGAALAAFLNTAAMVIFRDGIRDVTLAAKGLDVWNRHVVINWSVVILFLVLFVAGSATVAWMIWVMTRATGANERYA